MRRPAVTGQFERDLKRMKKRGKDTTRLRAAMEAIVEGKTLPEQWRDHKLKGVWRGRRECHIEPDWLLIYCLKADETVLFERTGSHADLFE